MQIEFSVEGRQASGTGVDVSYSSVNSGGR